MRPPMKIAKVVSRGRYIPTATSIGLRTWSMIITIPMRMPTTTSGHAICPATIPWARDAINPACGADRFGSPNPIPPARMLP